MTKRQMPMLIKILMLAFLLYAAVKIVGLTSQIAEKQEQLGSLNMRVKEYEASNEALRQEMQNGISDENISEIARSELGYAEPGERVFVDTSSK